MKTLQASIQGMSQQAELRRMEQALKAGQGSEDRQELKETCQEFESLFIQKLWSSMRKTVPQSSLLHSKAEEHYMSLFDQAFAREMSRNGGLGLGEVLLQQLQSRLEASSTHARSSEEGDQDLAMGEQGSLGLRNRGDGRSARILQEVESLAAEIEKRRAPVTDPQASPGVVSRGSETAPAESSTGSEGQRELTMPVEGQISSHFGWRTDPFTGEKAWHSGVDIAVEPGSPVKACWPGQVVFSGPREGYGNLVVVEHGNGWHSYYGHNRENLARVGDTVTPGQEIARSGSTGRSTGPHLHFELRQGQTAWDPMHIQRRVMAGLPIGRKA
jgi:murein DD-endopeptidase MepM/ murein hydrolase activator NlpD